MHCAGLRLDLRRSRHSCDVCQTALRPRRAVACRVAKPDTKTDVVANGNGPSRAEESDAATPVLTSRMIADITKKAPGEMRQGMAHTPHAAYQGVPGAYSESAALKACPDCVPLPCSQFENAFQALSQWMADKAVLPVENSLGGSIHAVYDLMLRYNLHIVGETSVAVNHCLMALPGTRVADLRRVMSHPQALAQCDTYIRNLGITREAVDDTAGAAQDIARHDLEAVGAIASSRAAELYNLEILDEGIQDDKSNLTRFVVLSRDPLLITDSEDGHLFKTSIVFTMPEGPGQLFRALSVFSLRDIDMTKIESRPMRENALVAGKDNIGRRFNYLFYVDFIGSMASVTCQNAMRHLNEIATFVRVLGCYPRDKF